MEEDSRFYDDMPPMPCVEDEQAPCGLQIVRPGSTQCTYANGFGCHQEPPETVREQCADSIRELHRLRGQVARYERQRQVLAAVLGTTGLMPIDKATKPKRLKKIGI